MGKTQFCRICRTEKNLKYTTKELRQLNKKQLLLAQAAQQGQGNNRASKKLLLTTPTLGNICQVCDERIQIFHRLDDGGHDSSSDVEVDVVKHINETLPVKFVDSLANRDLLQTVQRPETPVIVDDDDMLFNIFMQKFDQRTQLPKQQLEKQFTSQYHNTYTPPQSTGGSSEGDESKVIEVLTSRESTPTPTQHTPLLTSSSNMVDPQGHRIVAIIELDDIDENDQNNNDRRQDGLCTSLTSSSNDLTNTANVDYRSVLLSSCKNSNFKNSSMHETSERAEVEDDEEIVFCKVDSEKENSTGLKRRKRKIYDEKELRLVASLDLVSSDSETEGSSFKDPGLKTPKTVVTETSTVVVKKSFSCDVCELKLPDFESLSVHERVHQGVKCMLCQVGFQQVKRLIHHMRRKHRQYNGDALSEKPRSGQDSCMTIRLRYMQRTTFYECQLCGRIDDVFREHKEHIIEKHPNESKSLKDPIMKQLKCPVCKAKCGAQYLSLCRHLISLHEYQDYKHHLRELVHVSAFGWNAARQQEVAKTANIFQFIKRKTFFFKCKICDKIVAGYLHHLRHVKVHQKSRNETKVQTTAFKESSTQVSLSTSNLNKLCKSLKTNGVCISKKLRKRDNVSKKLVSHANLNNSNNTKIEKVMKTIKQPKENGLQKSKFNTNFTGKIKQPIKTVKYKKLGAEVENISIKKTNLKINLKPKDKKVEKLPNTVKITEGKAKKETSKKDNNKLKKKAAKVNDVKVKPKVKKIKIKTSVRQIDLQKYKCNYCLKKFKGFRLYNLHLLQEHRDNEYTKCNKCSKLYTNSANFKEHIKQCQQVLSTSKQTRKISKQAFLSKALTESSEPCVKKVPNKSDVSSTYLEDNYLWLKDLLKLKNPPEVSESCLNLHEPQTALFTQKPLHFQCCYCLLLFTNDKDLKEHEKHNHIQNSNILIKYKPFNKIR